MIAIGVWVCTRPPEHSLKRLVRVLGESQAEGWRKLFRIPEPTEAQNARYLRREPWFWRFLLALLVAVTGPLGVMSLMVLSGLAKNPPRPYEGLEKINPDDYELVIEEGVISARIKSPATTRATEGE